MAEPTTTLADVKISVNNKGLKTLFPKSVVTKKKLSLTQIDPKQLDLFIRSSLKTAIFSKYQIISVDMEGEYNDWSLDVKISLTY